MKENSFESATVTGLVHPESTEIKVTTNQTNETIGALLVEFLQSNEPLAVAVREALEVQSAKGIVHSEEGEEVQSAEGKVRSEDFIVRPILLRKAFVLAICEVAGERYTDTKPLMRLQIDHVALEALAAELGIIQSRRAHSAYIDMLSRTAQSLDREVPCMPGSVQNLSYHHHRVRPTRPYPDWEQGHCTAAEHQRMMHLVGRVVARYPYHYQQLVTLCQS